MKYTKFLFEMDRLKVQNGILISLVVILLFMNFSLLGQNDEAMNQHSTILIPAGMDREAKVYLDDADDTYLTNMGLLVSSIALNYTPSNVEEQFTRLLTMIHSESYPVFRTTLENLAKDTKVANITQTFHPKGDIQIDRERERILVPGYKITSINNTKGKAESTKYVIRYQFQRGLFQVLDIFEEKLYEPKNKDESR